MTCGVTAARASDRPAEPDQPAPNPPRSPLQLRDLRAPKPPEND